MTRIADKHGLTNPYREFGHKRLVKRGRKRKYILGSPSKKRKRASYKKVQKKSVQKETIQNQTVDWSSVNDFEDAEKIVKSCPNCGSQYIEKVGSVFVCGNCRATYKSIDNLVDKKVLSIFEQKNKSVFKKKWWHFWK